MKHYIYAYSIILYWQCVCVLGSEQVRAGIHREVVMVVVEVAV